MDKRIRNDPHDQSRYSPDGPTTSTAPQASPSPHPSPPPSPSLELSDCPEDPFVGYMGTSDNPYDVLPYPPNQPTTSTDSQASPSPHRYPEPDLSLMLANSPQGFLGWMNYDPKLGESRCPQDQQTTPAASQTSPSMHASPSPVTEESSQVKSRECMVCSSPLGDHIFYGVQSCKSCADFFRRSCIARKFNYTCDAPDHRILIISLNTGHLCRQCRFIKCLKLGMHPKYDNRVKGKIRAEPRNFDPRDKNIAEEYRMECQGKFLEKSQVKTRECMVCSSSGSSGIHYGVQACDSCRVFFRNKCTQSTFDYNCSNPGNCPLNRKRPCAHCRLIECLKLGMHPKYDNKGCRKPTERTKVRKFDPRDKEKIEDYRKECQAKFLENSLSIQKRPSQQRQEEGEPDARKQKIE